MWSETVAEHDANLVNNKLPELLLLLLASPKFHVSIYMQNVLAILIVIQEHVAKLHVTIKQITSSKIVHFSLV